VSLSTIGQEDLRGLLKADMWIQGGHQHQSNTKMLSDALLIGFNPDSATIRNEREASVRNSIDVGTSASLPIHFTRGIGGFASGKNHNAAEAFWVARWMRCGNVAPAGSTTEPL